jgi:PEP-CTERM motif
MRVARSVCFAAALAFVGVSSAHANLIQNGDFSDGFTDWTVGERPPLNTPTWVLDGSNPFSAPYDASGICTDPNVCLTNKSAYGLSQTVSDVNGVSYGLSFEFSPGTGLLSLDAAELVVDWDGAQIFDQTFNAATDAYSEFMVSGLVGGGTDTLTFFMKNDTGASFLDDVTLVPEPGSLAILGASLFAFGLRRRRKKQ